MQDDLLASIREAYRAGGAAGTALLLRPLAEAGDPDAQYWLGCLYFMGLEPGDSGPRAWFERAASQGHVEALYRLSTFTDGAEGESMLLRAGELGSLSACEALGVEFAIGEWSLGRDLARARHWYHRAAVGGSPTGQYELGLMLFYGEGGARDPTAGLGWLVRAASVGSLDAYRVLGLLFEERSEPLAANPEDAAIWREAMERASERVRARPIDPMASLEGLVPVIVRGAADDPVAV